jgi:hypothetical protein
MNEPTIVCPKCKVEIKLTEAMASPLIEASRREFATKLQAEKARIEQEARKNAADAMSLELQAKARQLADAERALSVNNVKLQEAQAAQAEAVKLKRELDDRARELDLTIEKRVSASTAAIREEARRAADADLGVKVSEKQLLIDRMTKTIDELNTKIAQGSQQAQGEVLELKLEESLRSRFVFDSIEPVPKGAFGGDVIQRVSENMRAVGTILWEFKRTKNWTAGWLEKLRGDQRAAKAEIAIIVSYALPDGIETFGMQEGIWITSPAYAIELCAVLRCALADVAAARQAADGQETKMEMLYGYLTGPQFRLRVGAIVENFGNMLEDLEKEKKVQEKIWAKREGQIRIAIRAAAGMYGDLQGIAGSAVGELPALDVKLLEDGKAASA